jgi:serine/threonine-protein kinase
MSEGADPALIGRRIAGKFVVEQFLGGGAMGAVYRARDDSLDRKVALKVMHPAVAVDPSFVSRFHREARAASRLDHPNSMRVIEFGEEPDGLLYIAMEYLEGRDLYKVIHEDWPLSEARIADVMMKALAAIAVAHEMGVIHRDLKPENIMILSRKDDEGHDIVKVCDFGIAKITERDEAAPDAAPKTAGAKVTTAGVVVGTPEYMSPEQARGEKLDSRSDLYSMGIILYQLLTGRTPFLADTALAVVLKHITEAPEPPHTIYPGVHKGLEAVCLRALAKAKEDRFQSARDMRAALKAVMDGRSMPVESNAETVIESESARVAGARHGSGAGPLTSPMSSPNPDALVQQPRAVSAPGGTSKVTPLGTAVASAEDKRSRAPLLIAVALVALLLGGAAVVLAQRNQGAKVEPPPPSASDSSGQTSIKIDVRPVAPPESTSATAAPTLASAPLPATESKAKRAPKSTAPMPSTSSLPVHEPSPAPSPQPVPSPEPQPQPEPTAAPTPVPPVAPPAPAPSAWSSASCRAALGAPKSASGYNVKDLALRGTDAAWTSCAKSAIKERPAWPISASVRLRFNDNKVFRGATCTGCAPALAQCIAASTGKTASVILKGGDQTGDPEFDVPVTFACE